MAQQTLYSEILTEAMNRYPDASRNEILECIIASMEKEVLPTVIRNLSLPEFPSWSDIAIEARGRKRKKKFKIGETRKERRLLIQQVEYLKRRLKCDGDSASESIPRFPDSDSLVFPLRYGGSSIQSRFKGNGQRTRKPTIETFHKPSEISVLKIEYPIILSKEIQEKITSDAIFENLFKNIEISIQRIIETSDVETNVEVSLQTDVEIPTWKKYTITINPSSRLKFEERMKTWEIFDLTIRNEIADLAKKANDNVREYISEINKNLFIHMEL